MIVLLMLFSITGNEVISRMDSVINAANDKEQEVLTTVIDSDGNRIERETRIYEKGEMRMLRFLSPAEDRGIGFLSISEDRMYIYLPSFNRVRRIASHIKKQSFLDTDFSYDELGTSDYTEDWDGRTVDENDSLFILKLLPLSEDEEYSELKMLVNKEHFIPLRIEFFNGDTKKKVLDFENYKKVNGYWIAHRMEMETVEENHRTIMEIQEVKLNQGLSDNIFTERNLKKY